MAATAERRLAEAIRAAADAHAFQVDKGGEAYILHCLEVMDKVAPDREAMIVAVLHDLQEDHPEYYSEHNWNYYGPVVKAAVDCLTKGRSEEYSDYIERVAGHPVARKVKIADLTHNMDTGRLPLGDLGEKDFKRWDKYRRALVRLKTEV